ncbi:MAG: InlB B-repeat-containing protein [Thermodesulfobacteriota bacterium]
MNKLKYLIILTFIFISPIFSYSQDITVNGDGSTIIIINNDGSNEGLNDPTLGFQRKNALQFAAELLADRLVSNVPIRIGFEFNPLTCTSNSAVLGSAGAANIFRDFSTNSSGVGIRLSNTWYPAALANAIAGSDLSTSNPDITARFNSSLDDGAGGCFGNTEWYYGTNASPGGDIDFVTVALHEMLHGLGFSSFISSSGALQSGFPGTYDLFLYHSGLIVNFSTNSERAACLTAGPNLVWDGNNLKTFININNITQGIAGGSRARIYAPSTYNSGSSVSHFDTSLNTEIMEPSYSGPNHNLDFTLALMEDIGWTLVSGTSPGTFALTVSKNGEGSGVVTSSPSGINCGSDCSENYNDSTVVQLTATADSGSEFASWSGSCSGTNNVTNVTLSQARSCTAAFNTIASGNGAFQETGGLVVIEAENYFTRISRGGKSWSERTTLSGFTGLAYMESTPDTGTSNNTNYSNLSTEMVYDVNFGTTGTYYVWIRSNGPDLDGDSLHVGIDGAENTTSNRIQLDRTSSFTWKRTQMGGTSNARLTVGSSGVHEINIWMREDGSRVDKILLTTSSSFVPTGNGPSESARN